MEFKDYQHRTLDAYAKWLETLYATREQADESVALLESKGLEVPEDLRNFPRTAWKKLAQTGGIAESAKEYVNRTDDAGRPIPHICFKIPTGGGKTLVGVAALERLNKQTGFVMWIVPSRAIYEQTKKALWSREHPYRRLLERTTGGRVKVLEKEDLFTKADIDHYLCVMLMMLPAVNRQRNKEFLRIYRDSGRYSALFPDTDDRRAGNILIEQHPDLERTSPDGPVKHSLVNALKILRPVVILDEAHKAYGKRGAEEYVRAVNQFNPSIVMELSATPNRRISNLLVDISGVELKQEEMIKLPIEVTTFDNIGWRDALARAHDKLEELKIEAHSLQTNDGQYIRPIALVRVERTGSNQRDGRNIHAEDVRDYLVQNLGEPPEAVRVKSSELNEIANEDLLSEFSSVRWIITKAALMEGWDCSFAYLLVILDNTNSQRALTQLMGRVMRQPYARRSGRKALDRCYVHCWQTPVDTAVRQVKKGLETEGLTGIGDDVLGIDELKFQVKDIQRRISFRNLDIFFPRVLHRDNNATEGWCELDYQRHILPNIDWDSISPSMQVSIPDIDRGPLSETIAVDVEPNQPSTLTIENLQVDTTISIEWFTRQISDLVPNPWKSSYIVARSISEWQANGLNEEQIYKQRRQLTITLRERIANEIERYAEQIFRDKLIAKEIRFDLEVGQPNFQMPDSIQLRISPSDHQLEHYGQPVQKSLFDLPLERDFNELESKFAFYLDAREAIQWWHRVAVRQQHEYYLRGWKPDRIWPDFLAVSDNSNGTDELLIIETKGKHLDNPDTYYKQKVLAALENTFNQGQTEYGEVKVASGPAKGRFRIVFEDEDFESIWS